MAYFNNGSGAVQTPLTAEQTATLAKYIATQQVTGQLANFTPTQIQIAMNNPQTVPNPQPNPPLTRIPATAINANLLLLALQGLFDAAIAAIPAQTAEWTSLQQLITPSIQNYVAQPGSFFALDDTDPFISGIKQKAIAIGNPAVTAQTIATALYFPNTNIPATIPASSQAWILIPGCWLEISDVENALNLNSNSGGN